MEMVDHDLVYGEKRSMADRLSALMVIISYLCVSRETSDPGILRRGEEEFCLCRREPADIPLLAWADRARKRLAFWVGLEVKWNLSILQVRWEGTSA